MVLYNNDIRHGTATTIRHFFRFFLLLLNLVHACYRFQQGGGGVGGIRGMVRGGESEYYGCVCVGVKKRGEKRSNRPK